MGCTPVHLMICWHAVAQNFLCCKTTVRESLIMFVTNLKKKNASHYLKKKKKFCQKHNKRHSQKILAISLFSFFFKIRIKKFQCFKVKKLTIYLKKKQPTTTQMNIKQSLTRYSGCDNFDVFKGSILSVGLYHPHPLQDTNPL